MPEDGKCWCGEPQADGPLCATHGKASYGALSNMLRRLREAGQRGAKNDT